MRGFFVTGTGTEVGKTVVAAALAHTGRAEGARVAVFKLAVSGLQEYPLGPEVWECAAGLPDHTLLRLAAGSRQATTRSSRTDAGPPSRQETIERLGSVPVATLSPLDLSAPDSWPMLPIREPVSLLREVA